MTENVFFSLSTSRQSSLVISSAKHSLSALMDSRLIRLTCAEEGRREEGGGEVSLY